MSILNSLLTLEREESRAIAVKKAEEWRDMLDEMKEVASRHELAAVHRISWTVNEYLAGPFEKQGGPQEGSAVAMWRSDILANTRDVFSPN